MKKRKISTEQDMLNSIFTGTRLLKADKSHYDNLEKIVEVCQKSDQSLTEDYISDIISKQIDLIDGDGVIAVPGKSGVFESGVEQLAVEDAILVSAKLKALSPTDEICVSENILLKLATFWQKSDDNCMYVPADIFWADTIPIHDCIIRNPHNGSLLKERNEQSVDYCRITIFDNPEMAKGHACGSVILSYNSGNVFFTTFGLGDPDEDAEAADKIIISHSVGLLKSEDFRFKRAFYKNPYLFKSNADGLFDTMFAYLRVWYGIQVGLLNPSVEHVFKDNTDPKHPVVETKKDRKGKTKTKIRYVRRLVITDDVFEECLDRSYIRTKLCWYVTGHWRNQATKTGHKKIFIQGYWKGVARDTKHVEEPREREMVLKSEYEQED